ncbi:hypothetical protein MPSEU_000892600 [Mayamaea pseudoterrestris]|nr:hypothetical protein MPSEU_000892600 [Mayamaea pseudoterrestris]
MRSGRSVLLFLAVTNSAWSFQSILRPYRSTIGRQSITKPLSGILDEIEGDSYNLSGGSSQSTGTRNDLADAYEVMLAEIVFSTNDPRVDIINKFDLVTDPDFLKWLEDTKIGRSNDPEERMALKDLLEIILDVKTKVEVSRLADERAAKEAEEAEQRRIHEAEARAAAGQQMTTADILKKANAIGTQTSETQSQDRETKKKTFYEQELTPEIRLSYESLLKKVLPPYKAGDSAATTVFIYYDQFDAQFVKVVNERAENGEQESKDLLEALAVEQQNRIAAASETLKSVLSVGDPMRMEGAIVRLAREGKVDEAFLLLLQANEDQAKAAGANGPAQLMAKLRKRAIEEKDKQTTSKEIRLIRQLLREDDVQVREKILEDAFTPKAAFIVPGTMENAQKALDGESPDQEKPVPEVPPPDFINACKAVLLNFGNVDSGDEERGDLATRIRKIASEAEVVATRIYGKGMTTREQQDRAWAETTTSIFDLEKMEIDAERRGEQAPWTNPDADDDMLLPGFDAQGRMKVGGG